MTKNLIKWWSTIKISWIKYTAYKLNFFLMILGPSLVFFFVKYNLWRSLYAGNKETLIKGFNFDQMIQYHLWAFIISLVASGFASWNLSDDIRLGRISSYLIYPFNFWEFHTASGLGFQGIQIFIATVTLITCALLQIVEIPSVSILITGILFTSYVSLFWFLIQYFTGILAFWLEETWILRVMLTIVATFLSGAIIPLDLYPTWLVTILDYTPFPYLAYYPIKIFQGQQVDLTLGFIIISFWSVIITVTNHLAWKKGIKLYTAAGM